MKSYAISDIGRVRSENQDCYNILDVYSDILLFAVCDGMGGASGGRTASRLAMETFCSTVRYNIVPEPREGGPDLGRTGLRYALDSAVRAANLKVLEAAKQSGGALSGMGTTLVALLVVKDKLALTVNVGDSRIYQSYEGKLTQLTHDHSLLQFALDTGRITEAEAEDFPEKNVITRAIGISEDIKPDIGVIDISGTKRPYNFLLCSDGLSGQVSSSLIGAIMGDPSTGADYKAERLVNMANSAGGIDNVTALIVEL